VDDVRDAVGAAIDVRASDTPADDLRAVAELARATRGALLVVHGDIVVHGEALRGLIVHPTEGTVVLTGSRTRPTAFRGQTRRGRMLSVASPYHTVHGANATFLGVLRAAPADLQTLADAAERLASLVAAVPEPWEEEIERKAERWRLASARSASAAALERDAAAASDEHPAANEFADPDDTDDAEADDADDADDADESDDVDDTADAAGLTLSEPDEAWVRTRIAAGRDDAVALALLGLVRGGARVSTVYPRRLIWARPLTPEAAGRLTARIDDSDEDQLLLDSAVKSGDGFFTTFFVSPYSKYIARWAARRGLTPNQVTTVSFVLGLLAAGAFAVGERWGLVAGAVLLQLAFTTDCVDGQLARYTRTFSSFGAWLDSVFDRAKEYVAFAGLAVGASRAGDPVWLLACAAITLQTVRHMSDFAYMNVRTQALAVTPQPPLEQVFDSAGAAAQARRARAEAAIAAGAPVSVPKPAGAVRALAAWRSLDHLRAVRWLKRMVAFPIGERFAVISITAALFTPRVTFVALLAWGALAFAYMNAGRVLRSLR
jgi:hypothetical protein